MEPELKTYLEGMEERLKSDISEVLDVVNDVKENTSNMIERMDDDILDIRQKTDNNSKRIDYLEKKLA